jgi:riboflavin synthase
MFTGLVEAVGVVSGVEPAASGLRLRIRAALVAELTPGESVAVDGCCLTVTATDGGEMHADVGPETARITTLGALHAGQPVNLERAMRGDGRFGGHFVQGHVDGVGTVERVEADGDSHWVSVALPDALAPYVVAKGSIAIDGISLTIAHLDDARLDVMIVPFTWQHTNLRGRRAGDRVNVECDMVGKYVARAVELFAGRASG